MGDKITGTTVFWAIALVAGFMLARDWLRDRLVAELQDINKHAVLTESPDFDKPLEFDISDLTMTQPIIPESSYYRPDQ